MTRGRDSSLSLRMTEKKNVTASLAFLSLRGFEEAVAISPFAFLFIFGESSKGVCPPLRIKAIPPLQIEEVRVPSSTLHPKDIKDEIASVAKNTTSQ